MKKVLIIGAAGYIGSTLTHLLLQSGYAVRAVDNFFKGNCDTLLPFVCDSNFEFQFGDITDYEHMKKAIKDVDFIIPMAALVGFPICEKYKTLAYNTNVKGVELLCHQLLGTENKIPIIYTSTGSVYGEVTSGLCTEDTSARPLSHYGVTKLYAEGIINTYERSIIHRYATACGIGYDSTRVNLLVNDLCYQAVANKSMTIFQADFKRTFVHVKDICRAILHTIGNFDEMCAKHRIYNVGNADLNYSKREIAELIRSKTGCHITYAETGADADARNYEVDYSRIYTAGWNPSYNMEYILNEVLKATPLLSPWSRYN